MTKFKVNVHAPRKIEQKYATLTVNIKEMETVSQANEIKEKLDAIIPGIIADSQGQKQLAPKSDVEKTKEKVVEKARKRTKKLDQAVGA